MKREWLAAGLLLLLIAGAIANLRAADGLLDTVEHSLHRAEQAARRSDYETALEALEEGRRQWNARRGYTQVFFRHADLDAIQDAFFSLEELLRQEDEAWPAALARLRYHLETADDMEHLSPGTIF